jgi:hypothetical protein
MIFANFDLVILEMPYIFRREIQIPLKNIFAAMNLKKSRMTIAKNLQKLRK